MSVDCVSWSGQHKYEARYDEVVMPKEVTDRTFKGMTADELRRFFVRQIYVCDVCVHCGDVIDRPEKP